MTLNMKFFYTTFFHSNENRCEEIAEEFAIGFMEWCQYEMPIEYFTYHTSIALLEIYKKEKGL